jgi:succinyl-diaminopimelate desuccinylase
MSTTLDLAKQLLALPSVTPDDAGCQDLLAGRLEPLGFRIESLPFGEVNNLWAVLGSTGPLLVFAGHTDVVPVGKPVWRPWLPPASASWRNGNHGVASAS